MDGKDKLKLLGKNIAKYRKRNKLSQNAFAEILNVSREHIAKVETAKRGISLSLLFKAADTLNIQEKDLFDFDYKEIDKSYIKQIKSETELT